MRNYFKPDVKLNFIFYFYFIFFSRKFQYMVQNIENYDTCDDGKKDSWYKLAMLWMKYTVKSKPVLRIRIRMFLGLLDPDLLVKGTDTDPSIIKQK